ncbi:MAG: IS1 family transposase [Leptolyngbyaceae cyanobacterium]
MNGPAGSLWHSAVLHRCLGRLLAPPRSRPTHVGKANTQRIERKHLTLRTRIKRLARKTICFSKSVLMHDTVIGLFINRYEFGRVI